MKPFNPIKINCKTLCLGNNRTISAISIYNYYLKFPTLINRWKNNSLSNFLCKLVIDKQLIVKDKTTKLLWKQK